MFCSPYGLTQNRHQNSWRQMCLQAFHLQFIKKIKEDELFTTIQFGKLKCVWMNFELIYLTNANLSLKGDPSSRV